MRSRLEIEAAHVSRMGTYERMADSVWVTSDGSLQKEGFRNVVKREGTEGNHSHGKAMREHSVQYIGETVS